MESAVNESTEALVPAGHSELAPLGTMHLAEGFSGIELPRLQIAYGVGRLSDNFNPGDLVLGDDNFLVKKGEPLEIVILTLEQFWKEYLSNDMYQAGLIPRVFQHEEEVLAAGGTTRFVQDQKPSFSKAVTLRLLIKKPEDLECGMFGLELPDGGVYAPAVITLDKAAYRKAGAGLISTCALALQGNLLAGRFAISTRSEKLGNNMTVVPSIKLLPEKNSAEVQEAIRMLFSN